MIRILALSGSLRTGSFNTALAHNAARLAPTGISVEVATLHGIPLYNADDEEQSGIPETVTALKKRVLDHDGLLLITPEYNNGIPGVMKNGIDWLSRAGYKEIFSARPVAVIGATTGGWGTLSAQIAWLQTLRMLGTTVYNSHRLMLAKAHESFDSDGQLSNPDTERMLTTMLQGFAHFIGQQRK